ncbi:MAG: MATE family efflux transporter [Burkholderiaceae bacterium]
MASHLPACRLDAMGRPQVSLRAVFFLAFPLFLHAGLQGLLNLIDTWFVGRISTSALAGVGGIYWLILGALFFLTGMGMAVQTVVAQSYGAGRMARAAAAVWSGLWIAVLVAIPASLVLAALGPWLVPLIGLSAAAEQEALAYWAPRFLGGAVILAETAVLSFFMGIGRVRVALLVNTVIVISNTLLNAWFVFGLAMGVAGVAWATTLSLCLGLALSLWLFLAETGRSHFRAHRVWRPHKSLLKAVLGLGLPIGFSIGIDVLGFAAFQAMMSRLGDVQGAASQVVIMLTSMAFLPAVGLGKAGTTLVGQSMGAGNPQWAKRVGNVVIALSMGYMFLFGLALAIFGEAFMRFFVSPQDPQALALITLGAQLALIAAVYQVFDGLHLGAVFCLRGAGDARVPALVLFVLSWGLFVPLTHILVFAPGQGFIDALPALGYGAAGGWWASVIYIVLLAGFLSWRWFGRPLQARLV